MAGVYLAMGQNQVTVPWWTPTWPVNGCLIPPKIWTKIWYYRFFKVVPIQECLRGVALKTPELPRLPAGKTDRFFKMSLTTRQQTHEIRKSREIHQQKYGGKITTKKMGGFRPSPNHFFWAHGQHLSTWGGPPSRSRPWIEWIIEKSQVKSWIFASTEIWLFINGTTVDTDDLWYILIYYMDGIFWHINHTIWYIKIPSIYIYMDGSLQENILGCRPTSPWLPQRASRPLDPREHPAQATFVVFSKDLNYMMSSWGWLEFTYHTLSYIVLHCHTLHFLDQAEYQWACDLPEPHFLGPTECSKLDSRFRICALKM